MKLAITHKKALIFSVGAILCILVSINPFQTFKIATIGYGDELAPHNRFSLLEERYPDYKTAMEYVNDHYQEGDAIIIDSDPHQIYCKHSITAALNRNVPNPTTLEDVLSIIENHDRTWITYGYIDPDSHTYESFKEIWRFLEDNKENMVYKGGDPARAYLFTKDSPLVI